MGEMPVNNEILKWARESSNISIEDVAYKMDKTKEDIESWEKGEESPTYIQLETLAYKVYKRPIAIFFFPEPPTEESPQKSFRSLPDSEIQELPSKILRLFRQAQAMQIKISELCEGTNPAEKMIFRDISINPNDRVSDAVKTIRSYLGADLTEQINWKDTTEALKNWRDVIEEKGIFVFKDAFRQDEISGFCLYDSEFPIIYINNSMPKTRQIFTLFHELSHLLFKTGGIDKILDTYVNSLSGDDRRIEIFCNKFAGDFLVPENDFNQQIKNVTFDDISISNLANRYNVSIEVILRKLYDRKLIDKEFYNDKAKIGIKKAKRRRQRSQYGGDYYKNKVTYLGKHYLDLAFSQYYRNRISEYQLADYLGTKVNNISGLEIALNGVLK